MDEAGSPEYRREQDTNQRTKPASNAGLMDGGRPDGIRDNGRCDPIGNRGNGKKGGTPLLETSKESSEVYVRIFQPMSK